MTNKTPNETPNQTLLPNSSENTPENDDLEQNLIPPYEPGLGNVECEFDTKELNTLLRENPEIFNKIKLEITKIKDQKHKKAINTPIEYQEVKKIVYSTLENDPSITSWAKLRMAIPKGSRVSGTTRQLKLAWNEYKLERMKTRPAIPPKITETITESVKNTTKSIIDNQNDIKQTFEDFKKELVEMLKQNNVDSPYEPVQEIPQVIPTQGPNPTKTILAPVRSRKRYPRIGRF